MPRGGSRPGAGRKRGGKNRATLERQALLEQAAEQGLMPVDFMLAEMRNTENPKEMRLELARWVAPYCSPRRASISVVKSIHEMSREELEWAIADPERGPVTAVAGHTAWRPRIVKGGR